jgi:hypothetical protein
LKAMSKADALSLRSKNDNQSPTGDGLSAGREP